jgi:hypothetical protein
MGSIWSRVTCLALPLAAARSLVQAIDSNSNDQILIKTKGYLHSNLDRSIKIRRPKQFLLYQAGGNRGGDMSSTAGSIGGSTSLHGAPNSDPILPI